ncbi:hypothetical protein TVAG_319800 [Trichomonas vaginalis G3]|uniref:COMM domain-containing protein n=1 Tax=Trichomonas vaginalis (strain ATCC PRA-98 / G3) TaxID=412133 RepID=A2DQC8_TRIV3|nr:COMM domain family [Trichomonas vaginalis G3]EAY17385.1 hypothetical protein TVAG_319800 [Trichomonas vaginalis G3]KAI5491395.1 COMM domain family [Trichomonas vaginalis G3]|eukprot:XP_001330754.1 hypothetical protein [Trichomonas vaginalis G3]
MSELSFLKEIKSPVEAWKSVLTGSDLAEKLTDSQIEKIKLTTNYVYKQPAEKRSAILSELGCPNADGIADLLKSYEAFLKEKSTEHNLVDFDWSASLILGTSKISNLKEPIVTFSFQLKDGTQRHVEFTADEAEAFLKQLTAAQDATTALIPN